MKKFVLILVICCLNAVQSKAQVKFGFTAGPQLLVNSNRFSNIPQLGFGGNLSLEYEVWEPLSLGSIIGYDQFEFERYPNYYTSIAMLIKCMPGHKKLSPVFEFDIGWYAEDFFSIIGMTSYFGIAPAFGVVYSLNDNTKLTVNLKFNYLNIDIYDLKFYGLNLGVIF